MAKKAQDQLKRQESARKKKEKRDQLKSEGKHVPDHLEEATETELIYDQPFVIESYNDTQDLVSSILADGKVTEAEDAMLSAHEEDMRDQFIRSKTLFQALPENSPYRQKAENMLRAFEYRYRKAATINQRYNAMSSSQEEDRQNIGYKASDEKEDFHVPEGESEKAASRRASGQDKKAARKVLGAVMMATAAQEMHNQTPDQEKQDNENAGANLSEKAFTPQAPKKARLSPQQVHESVKNLEAGKGKVDLDRLRGLKTRKRPRAAAEQKAPLRRRFNEAEMHQIQQQMANTYS